MVWTAAFLVLHLVIAVKLVLPDLFRRRSFEKATIKSAKAEISRMLVEIDRFKTEIADFELTERQEKELIVSQIKDEYNKHLSEGVNAIKYETSSSSEVFVQGLVNYKEELRAFQDYYAPACIAIAKQVLRK